MAELQSQLRSNMAAIERGCHEHIYLWEFHKLLLELLMFCWVAGNRLLISQQQSHFIVQDDPERLIFYGQ